MASPAVWRLLKRGSWRARIELGELKRASTVLCGSCWLNWWWTVSFPPHNNISVSKCHGPIFVNLKLLQFGSTFKGSYWEWRNACPVSQLSAQLVVQSPKDGNSDFNIVLVIPWMINLRYYQAVKHVKQLLEPSTMVVWVLLLSFIVIKHHQLLIRIWICWLALIFVSNHY